ncbi:MAG TPA: hypothetical protein VM869_00775 [Enhygromyxa sp.]|nr:hypothetical protein [Enhygromyxa sp.]
MTENELERWTTLVVAEARGQSLSPAARAERRQIEREQPELLGEASLWAEFAELEQPRPGERDDAAMIADVLARAQPKPEQAPARTERRVLGPALGLLALAACVALSLALGQLRGHGPQAIDRGEQRQLGGAAMALDEQPELLVATPGRHHLHEDDCRRAGASARLCTREQARFRVASSSTEQRVELELDDGQLHIDATDGTQVDVLTAAGVVRARGVVELRFDASTGALVIDVIDGEAELLGSEPTPVRLGVGATLSLIADTRPTIEPLAPEPEPDPIAPEPAHPPEPSAPSKAPPPSADELLAAASSTSRPSSRSARICP